MRIENNPLFLHLNKKIQRKHEDWRNRCDG